MEIPNTFEKARRLAGHTGKMIVVGVLVIICWIASLLVLGIISERSSRQSEAEMQIAEQWGRPQLIAGPVIVVPFNKLIATTNAPSQIVRQNLYILPKELNADVKLEPEVRSRGIFSAPVYRSHMAMSGSFRLPSPSEQISLDITPSSLIWREATLVMGLSDTRNITVTDLKLDGGALSFVPGSSMWNVNGMGVQAPIPRLSSPTGGVTIRPYIGFKIDFDVTGSKGISFLPLGEVTKVSASAPWGSPSFFGAYLPDTETINKNDFKATWHISSLGRSYPSAWVGTSGGMSLSSDAVSYPEAFFDSGTRVKPINVYSNSGEKYGQALASSAFGVNLFREVTFYTLVSRTVKYAILFIALTFLAFYLFEVISRTRVHPFQYLLIGAALVLFYLLLLSFSEHIGFALAYLLSSILTLGLVTAYSASVLKAKSRAWIIAAILIVLYAYLYAILQLENFALLFGTLFLFVALAAVMRATRKIEWYSQVE